MKPELIFARFQQNWRRLSAALGPQWPALRGEFLRIADRLRDAPASPRELADMLEGSANLLVEELLRHPAGQSLLRDLAEMEQFRRAGDGTDDDAIPTEDAIANQYPRLRDQILQTADAIAAVPPNPPPSGVAPA